MDFKKELLKYIDLKGIAINLILEQLVKKKLDELVLSTDNALDDALVAMIYPELKRYAEEQLDELIDMLDGEEAPAGE